MTRRTELRDSWRRVSAQVATECIRHGRSPEDVTIIAVTKGHPMRDIEYLAEAGVTDIGESRDAEAHAKRTGIGSLPLRWHCIGQVQTNKAAKIVAWADVVHSVDRARVAQALAAAVPPGRQLDVLVQVNTDPQSPMPGPARGGVSPADVADLLSVVDNLTRLRLAGLMTVAPLQTDATVGFKLVADLHRQLQASHPGAHMFSAGMSGDFSQAIAAGATHLRIGTAILGSR